MPFDDTDTGVLPGTLRPYEEPPKEPSQRGVSSFDTFGAFMRRENTVGSAAAYIARGGLEQKRVDPNYDVLAKVRGTKYEGRLLEFVRDSSDEDVAKTMARIDLEDRDTEIVQNSGWAGLAYGVAAGVLDPTIAIPAGGFVMTGRAGYRIARSAASLAAGGAAGMAVTEGVLQMTQSGRTAEESVVNIASGAILGGILGGGAASFLSNAERRLAAQIMDVDRENISRSIGQPVPPRASSDERTAEAPTVADAQPWATGPRGQSSVTFGGAPAAANDDVAFRNWTPKPQDEVAAYTSPVVERLGREVEDLKSQAMSAIPPDEVMNRWEAEGVFDALRARSYAGDPNVLDGWMKWKRAEVAYLNKQAEAMAARVGENLPHGYRVEYVDVGFGSDAITNEILRLTGQKLSVREAHVVGPDNTLVQVLRGNGVGYELGSPLDDLLMGRSRSVERPVDAAQRTVAAEDMRARILEGPVGQRADDEFGEVANDNVVIGHTADGTPIEVPRALPSGPQGTAGAAFNTDNLDNRTLTLKGYLLDSVPGLNRVVASMSPTLRVFSQPIMEARRVMGDLAETALVFVENAAGVPTATRGGPVDRLVRNQINAARMAIEPELDRLWMSHRFGSAEAGYARIQASKLASDVRDLMASAEDGKLSFDAFKREIGRALRRSDAHDVPEVAQAAKLIREKVFEPWKNRILNDPTGKLKEAFGWPENVDPKTAESYFSRVYNREAIRQNKVAVQDQVFRWLTVQQAEKAAIHERLRSLQDQLESIRGTLGKIEAREERLAARRQNLETRLDERGREVQRTIARTEDLTRRNIELDDEIADLNTFVEEMKGVASDPETKALIGAMENDLKMLRQMDRRMTLEDLQAQDVAERGAVLAGPMRRVANIIAGREKSKKPPSFLHFIRSEGGIKDTDGNIRQIIGDPRKYPGLINNKSGRDIDEWGEKLADEFGRKDVEGYLQRYDQDEVARMIADAARGQEPEDWLRTLSAQDAERLEAYRLVAVVEDMFERLGVKTEDIKTPRDVADILAAYRAGTVEIDPDPSAAFMRPASLDWTPADSLAYWKDQKARSDVEVAAFQRAFDLQLANNGKGVRANVNAAKEALKGKELAAFKDGVRLAKIFLENEPHRIKEKAFYDAVGPEAIQKLNETLDRIIPQRNTENEWFFTNDTRKPSDWQYSLHGINPAEGKNYLLAGEATGYGLGTTVRFAIDLPMGAHFMPHLARHESIHALKRMGVFTPDEWRTLEQAAKDNDWLGHFGKPDTEEAIAEAFGAWGSGAEITGKFGESLTPKIKAIFGKIIDFYKKLRDAALDIAPKPEWEQIFQRIESGEIGRREIKGRGEGSRGSSASVTPDGRDMTMRTLDDMDRELAEMEAAGEWIPAGMRAADVADRLAYTRADIAKTRQMIAEARADRGTVEKARVRGGAREAEARLAEGANLGRFGVLQDQLSRAETKQAILDSVRANAEVVHDRIRKDLEDQITQWKGKSSVEAIRAIEAAAKADEARQAKIDAGFMYGQLYKGDGKRLTSADKAVDRAVRRILDNDPVVEPEMLRLRANEIVERLVASPEGRIPYDIASPTFGKAIPQSEVRGALNSRDFMIPDEMLDTIPDGRGGNFSVLEDDVEAVVGSYLNTVVTDVHLVERFGDTAMTEAFRRIDEDANRMLLTAPNQKERTKIVDAQRKAKADIVAVRDRIRGVYALPANEQMRNAYRVAAAVKNYNVITDLGGATLNSLGEIAMPVFRYGFMKVFGTGYGSLMQGIREGGTLYQAAKGQLKKMGIVNEVWTNSRVQSLGDIVEPYRQGTLVERGLFTGANASQILNLNAHFTDHNRAIAGMLSMDEILSASRAVATGKATQKQIQNLAASSIDANMARRIWAQFENGGGGVHEGVKLPNTADWTDLDARTAFEGAVAREVDIAVINPGQEKPLWLSSPLLSVLGQFRTFVASANERILIAQLQQRDANTLAGVVSAVAGGMLSYVAYSVATNQFDKLEKASAVDFVREGISRSGVLGWLEELNTNLSKATGNRWDMYRAIGSEKPLSKYSSRSPLGQLLGPTAGKIEGVLDVTRHAAAGEWKAKDTDNVRRLAPFQNLIGLRLLLDQVESGVNQAFGIPERTVR
jgi:hypothetical protein